MAQANELAKARITVERLLKIRLRSQKELEEKLNQKSFSPETISAIINQYQQMGLVDDRLFAKSWIASRLKRPFGARRINLELIQKGVNKEIIQEELHAAREKTDENAIVKELAEHRSKKYKGLDKKKAKQRLYGYLSRRGFSYPAIMKAIKEL